MRVETRISARARLQLSFALVGGSGATSEASSANGRLAAFTSRAVRVGALARRQLWADICPYKADTFVHVGGGGRLGDSKTIASTPSGNSRSTRSTDIGTSPLPLAQGDPGLDRPVTLEDWTTKNLMRLMRAHGSLKRARLVLP